MEMELVVAAVVQVLVELVVRAEPVVLLALVEQAEVLELPELVPAVQRLELQDQLHTVHLQALLVRLLLMGRAQGSSRRNSGILCRL